MPKIEPEWRSKLRALMDSWTLTYLACDEPGFPTDTNELHELITHGAKAANVRDLVGWKWWGQMEHIDKR